MNDDNEHLSWKERLKDLVALSLAAYSLLLPALLCALIGIGLASALIYLWLI